MWRGKRMSENPIINEYQININDYVKIKLTQTGRDYLTQEGVSFEEDDLGLSQWQLWTLMEVFGPVLTPCYGDSCYFEPVIRFEIKVVNESNH